MISLDLTTAILVISSLTVWAFFAGRSLGSMKKQSAATLFVAALSFCLAFSWLYSGKLVWANSIPLSGVVYWSNFMPILLGFTAGVACRTTGLNRWARPLTVTTFALIALTYLALPIGRPMLAPAIVDAVSQWDDDVCLQSHGSTCAAAAAATLLHLNGIQSSESEMVGPCLTSEHGTEALGLYRGLKIGARDHGHQVRVASSSPTHWLDKGQLPNVALVSFARNEFAEDNSNRWFMGPRGEGHAVVILAYEQGRWIIGDPAVGRVSWSDEELQRRFTGDAIYLSLR